MSKGPQQPVAPDPVATAKAQSEYNKTAAITQAELDRINQNTPNGSVSYKQIGTFADGTPQYEQNTTLTPELAAVNDGINHLANVGVTNASTALSTPLSFDGATPYISKVGADQPALDYGPTSIGATASDFARGKTTTLTGKEGNQIQTSLDFSGAPKLSAYNDFGGDARNMENAVYRQYAARLDPRFSQEESDTRARLAAQGISENSDAYRRELDNFGRTKNDAYGQAEYQAQQAGAAEQSRLFGLSSTARKQIVDEITGAGDFRNSAQGQIFGNAATTASVNNAAQAQVAEQNLAAAKLQNEATQQQLDMAIAKAGANNTAVAQGTNTELANATLNNSVRQAQVGETTALRETPINEIAALLGTGTTVANPTFNPVPQVGIAAPDYAGLVQNNYTNQMNAYNTAQQAKSSALGGIFGAVGKIGGAIAMSDIRVKQNIRRIGALRNGISTYSFQYRGSRLPQFGVMAQEVFKVIPEAVAPINGILHVDYSKVYA